MASQDIWVYSERNDIALELLAKARQLAGDLGGKVVSVLVGDSVRDVAPQQLQYGADSVKVLQHPGLKQFDSEVFAEILAQRVKADGPSLLIMGDTRRGRELAARLGQKLRVPALIDAIDVAVEGGAVTGKRLLLGGRFVTKFELSGLPKIVSIGARRFQPRQPDSSRTGEIVELSVVPPQPRVRVTQVGKKEVGGVKIEDAGIIVSAGRGVKKKEDLAVIRELATALGGEVGCSRPIAEDLKWLPADHWVGLSGHKVKPKLYIACGISGQIQHLAGMRESGVVVAINKDETAPIHQSADYSVVTDLYQFVPALSRAIKQVLGKP